jgi:hypothetical protein
MEPQVAARRAGLSEPIRREVPRPPEVEFFDDEEDEDLFVGHGRDGRLPLPEAMSASEVAATATPAHLRRVAAGALVVGAIGGFCAGLIASKWLM